MKIDLEQTILRNLLTDEKYMRKVIPFIKPDFFEGVYRSLFSEVIRFVQKYNKLPSLDAFKIEIDQSTKFTEQTYTHALDILPSIFEKKEDYLNLFL